MLADFAMRRLFGLALAAAVGPRGVPHARSGMTCLTMLGLSSLSVLSSWKADGARASEFRAAIMAAAAMLLGHRCLTAPPTAIPPSLRAIGLVGAALAIRAGLASWGGGLGGEPAAWQCPKMRWGIGLAGPAIAIPLAWNAAGIRATQSATGFHFVSLGFVPAGELASVAAARGGLAIVRARGDGTIRWN